MALRMTAPHSPSVWSDVEVRAWRDVQRDDSRRLVEQLRYVLRRSDFYRRKYEAAGLDLAVVPNMTLEELPLTEKAELRESARAQPPFGAYLAANKADLRQIQVTSGTTGIPTYIALTRTDIAAWDEMTARALYAGGGRPYHKLFSGFSQGRGVTGGLPMNSAYRFMELCAIPVGVEAGIDRILEMLRDLRPEVLGCPPFFAADLAASSERVVGQPAFKLGVRHLIVGGEPGGGVPALRRRLTDAWDATVAEMMGLSDIGLGLWLECLEGAGMHFCAQGIVLPELVEPEGKRVLSFEEGVTGEMVYTALRREAGPLIRFRSGDMIEVVGPPGTCACGRTSPRVRCLGRLNERLEISGHTVWPSALIEHVYAQPKLTGRFRISLDSGTQVAPAAFTLHAEHEPGIGEVSLRSIALAVERAVEEHIGVACRVECVPEGVLAGPGVRKSNLVEFVR